MDSLLFSCTCMNDDEQKHNNVKFQIEFPIFFFPFLPFFVILHPPYYTPCFCLNICSFLQRGRRLGKVGYDCILILWQIKKKKTITIKC